MNEDTDPFIFPDLPDEAVIAVDQFLEAFYHRFQNHYFAQMHRWYHALDEHRESNRGLPPTLPLKDPPF
jgi:hypothetical protein